MKISSLSLAGQSTFLTQAYATFTYKYYMHGSNIGYFRWYWLSGTGTFSGTLTRLTGLADGTSTSEVAGEKQTNGNQSWKDGSIDLIANGIKGTGRIVLLYAKSLNQGFRGDAAFQRMKMTVNSVTTDLSPPSSSFTGWKGQSAGAFGLSPSEDMEPELEDGNLSFNTVNTTTNGSNGPWAYRTNAVPSGCSNTGPCQEDGNDGSFYVYCETSNNSGNMFSAARFAFLLTTNTFTI